MARQKRKMPTEQAIRAYWVGRLWKAKGYDSPEEFMEHGTCFACGMSGAERAHIQAKCEGGADSVENLHILCGVCHKDSESMEGDKYMGWLIARTAPDMFASGAARRGLNLWRLLNH